MSDRNVFRLRSWTHYDPKPAKGEKRRVGLISAGFNALPGRHAIMLCIGSVADTEGLTTEGLAAMLDAAGLRLKDDAAITEATDEAHEIDVPPPGCDDYGSLD